MRRAVLGPSTHLTLLGTLSERAPCVYAPIWESDSSLTARHPVDFPVVGSFSRAPQVLPMRCHLSTCCFVDLFWRYTERVRDKLHTTAPLAPQRLAAESDPSEIGPRRPPSHTLTRHSATSKVRGRAASGPGRRRKTGILAHVAVCPLRASRLRRHPTNATPDREGRSQPRANGTTTWLMAT